MWREKPDPDDKSKKQLEGYIEHIFHIQNSKWRYVHCALITVVLLLVCITVFLGAEVLFHPEKVLGTHTEGNGKNEGRARKGISLLEPGGSGFVKDGNGNSKDSEADEVRCAVGSRAENEVCVRNTYFPNAIDVSMMNASASPCHNFYQYACGSYVSDFLNEDKDAVWWYLGELSKAWIKKLTNDALESNDSAHTLHDSVELAQLRAFYESCVSSSARAYYNPRSDVSELGSGIVHLVDSAKNPADLSRVFGTMLRHGVDGPVAANVEVHPRHPSKLVAMLVLHTGDEESVEDVSTVVCRTASSRVQCQSDAKEIHALQTALASIVKDASHASISEYTDSDAEQDLHNSSETADVQFRWFSTHEFFSGLLGVNLEKNPVGMIWTYRTSHLKALDMAMGSVRLETWRQWCLYRLSVTGDGFSWNKESARRTLSDGTQQHGARQQDALRNHAARPPWKRGSPFRMTLDEKRLVATSARGDPSACRVLMYTHMSSVIDMHLHSMEYDPRTSLRVSEIHSNVTLAMLAGIQKLYKDDVSDTTMRFLQDKLSSTRVMAGFPENMDHLRTNRRSTAFHESSANAIAGLSSSDDLSLSIFKVWRWRTEALWGTFVRGVRSQSDASSSTPDAMWYQECGYGQALWKPNAYYVHQLNTVFITKAALRPPLYSPLYNLLSLYARLGVVIAHECAHSIDRAGLAMSEIGAAVDWTGRSRDKAVCEEFMTCIASVYENELGGISASRTVNENFADTVAFSAAWDAFVNSGSATDLESRKDFYVIYAQGMCRPVGPADKEFYLAQALHSPPDQRVNNVVTMHEDFCDIWKCTPDTEMFKRAVRLKRCKKKR